MAGPSRGRAPQGLAALALALALLGSCAAPSAAPSPLAGRAPLQDEEAAADDRPGVVHTVLLYIPNRIFDLLDVARLRLRFGPGLAFGARATEFVDVYLGGYSSFFVGLPGPREAREINWPFGFEASAGAEISLLDVGASGGVNYGWLEVGLGGQLFLIGLDVGLDVFEALDFVTGIVTLDPGDDDL